MNFWRCCGYSRPASGWRVWKVPRDTRMSGGSWFDRLTMSGVKAHHERRCADTLNRSP